MLFELPEDLKVRFGEERDGLCHLRERTARQRARGRQDVRAPGSAGGAVSAP